MLMVRAATPDDATEVARVHVRSWQVGYRGLLPDAYLDGLRPEDRAAHYTFGDTSPGRPATIVAVVEGTVWGFTTTGPSRDDDAVGAGELLAIYVDPDRWGHGAGRLLIAAGRDRLGRQGFVDVILWVLAGNDRAQRFYHADGWVPDGSRRQQEVWGVMADEVRYRRPLP
jgi:GNAT superfamily N-acetyltransferase